MLGDMLSHMLPGGLLTLLGFCALLRIEQGEAKASGA
jgi:hypothetical protein